MRRFRSTARLVLPGLLVPLLLVALPGCKSSKRQLEVGDNDELYNKAQLQIERRRFTDAVATLGDIGLGEPVSPELDPEVKLALADAYFFQRGQLNAVEAQSRYEQFLSFYPTHEKASYARYMVGLCLLDQAEDPDNDQEFSLRAVSHFEALVADLPAEDPWGKASRAMLVKAQDRLAEHEWLIAEFYFKKEAWNATIGRVTAMLDRYPGTRRRAPALMLLAQSYRGVGKNGLARTTAEQVIAEFPLDPLAQQAQKLVAALPAEDATPAAPTPAEAGKGRGKG